MGFDRLRRGRRPLHQPNPATTAAQACAPGGPLRNTFRWPKIPTRLRWALIVVVGFHGGLLLFGTYRGTYDAYVHLFLADHYRRDWFSTWDFRWYTGFTTVSYPPGTHMAMAFVGKFVGLETAFAIVQLIILLLLAVGMYRFARVWVNDDAAANAALLVVGSSTIAQTVHLYGQLPTTFALTFLLHSIPFIRRWVVKGRPIDLILGTTVLAACTAGHHVTTLFGSVFFLGPVLVHALLEQSRVPLVDELEADDPPMRRRTLVPLMRRRLRRILPHTLRAGMLGPAVLAALVIVVLPYWIWSGSDPINQVSIPHGSRSNFLEDRNIGFVFFLIPWGLMLPLLPYCLMRAVLDRKWPIASSILLLFVLGTGGTTPVPKLLLGAAFDILTLDRFTFWAAMQIMPLAGLFMTSLERGTIAGWLRQSGGRAALRLTQVGLAVAMIGFTLFSATLSQYRPFQPDRIDPTPIVSFLEKDQHERWRFLTLGFGDQMAWLSAQTMAMQVDGNYHSVRRLPELTSTSVERLEGAKYRGISGLGSLQQFLEVPEKYHLKFVFSNDAFYDPLLHFLGWQRLGVLENGIMVWERADIPPLPAELPSREVPGWQRVMWGTIPPTMIVSALLVLIWTFLGRPGLRRYHDPLRSNDRLLRGPLLFGLPGRLDRWLAKSEPRLSVAAAEIKRTTRPPLTTAALSYLRAWATRPVGRIHKAIRITIMLAVVLWWPIRITTTDASVPSAEKTTEAFFDDLDFRRFEDAYARLDPVHRPDYELWRLQLSVNGGLLASFAKLDSIEVHELAEGDDERPDEATVRADLRYITALDWYPIIEDVELVRREDGQWYVRPEPADLTIPPDQLSRRAEVDYIQQGRRRVTSSTTDLTDIQDRPELFLRNATLLEHEGRPVIVGEVDNIDVDPADITITGVLRDADDTIIARYNATEHMVHALRPRESTPFRIEFEEVAAGVDLDFDPLQFEPIQLDEEIASVEVYAKAVVTSGGLYRGLGVNTVEITENTADGTWRLTGELRNDGVLEATIPMLVVSYLDADGEVGWVDRFYIEAAVRSQRTGLFSVPIPVDVLAALNESSLTVRLFHNGIAPPGGVVDATPPLLRLDDIPELADLPYESIRIEAVTFLGSE